MHPFNLSVTVKETRRKEFVFPYPYRRDNFRLCLRESFDYARIVVDAC